MDVVLFCNFGQLLCAIGKMQTVLYAKPLNWEKST